MQAATVLCTCVFDGNMPLVKRYVAAGVPIDAGDYDLRTPLHISAAEGNLTAVCSLYPLRNSIAALMHTIWHPLDQELATYADRL